MTVRNSKFNGSIGRSKTPSWRRSHKLVWLCERSSPGAFMASYQFLRNAFASWGIRSRGNNFPTKAVAIVFISLFSLMKERCSVFLWKRPSERWVHFHAALPRWRTCITLEGKMFHSRSQLDAPGQLEVSNKYCIIVVVIITNTSKAPN